jgi:hypothetical protein
MRGMMRYVMSVTMVSVKRRVRRTVGSRFSSGPKRVKMIRTVGKTASHVTTAIL